jgi:hypothetical protein
MNTGITVIVNKNTPLPPPAVAGQALKGGVIDH